MKGSETKNYLDVQLNKLQKDLDSRLEVYKQSLNNKNDRAMLSHVEHAKRQIEKEKKLYLEIFHREMEDIEKQRLANENKYLLYRREEFAKRKLERSLNFALEVWLNFIRSCQN